jgi:AbrB family looped-hinge helix DNA binding protein
VYFFTDLCFCIQINHTFAAKYEISYKSQKSINMEANNGKFLFGVVKVGERGQIVIPKEAREQYDIKPGDSLMVLGDDKGIALLKTEVFQEIINQAMKGLTK